MKVNKKELVTALKHFSFIKAKMIPMSNANIRMTLENGVLTLLGHDLYNSVEVTLNGIEGENFDRIVAYTKFKSLLNTHREDVTITFDETYCTISSAKINNKLVVGQGKFQNKPLQQGKQTLEMESEVLVTAVKKAVVASSKIGGRPELEAILFSDAIVGCNTYLTAISEIDAGLDFLLGQTSVNLIKNLKGDVSISSDDIYVTFETETHTLFCRRLAIGYVPYTTMIADNVKAAVNVDSSLLIDMLKNCKANNDEKVTIRIGNTLVLTSFGRSGSSDIKITTELDPELSMSGSYSINVSPVDILSGIGAMKKSKRIGFEMGINTTHRKKSIIIFDDGGTFNIVEKR